MGLLSRTKAAPAEARADKNGALAETGADEDRTLAETGAKLKIERAGLPPDEKALDEARRAIADEEARGPAGLDDDSIARHLQALNIGRARIGMLEKKLADSRARIGALEAEVQRAERLHVYARAAKRLAAAQARFETEFTRLATELLGLLSECCAAEQKAVAINRDLPPGRESLPTPFSTTREARPEFVEIYLLGAHRRVIWAGDQLSQGQSEWSRRTLEMF